MRRAKEELESLSDDPIARIAAMDRQLSEAMHASLLRDLERAQEEAGQAKADLGQAKVDLGQAKAEADRARRVLLNIARQVLESRFGPLPGSTLDRLERASTPELETLAARALKAETLEAVFDDHLD